MFDLDKIEKVLETYPKFRKKQTYDAIFRGFYSDWEQATNLPPQLKEQLQKATPLGVENKLFESKDGKTAKALVYLDDGKCIETVLMSLGDRHSVCVSTQVGCPMGCAFCDSGRNGFTRNLTVSEIVAQVIFFERYLKSKNNLITNIVFMGMGEPFLNYDNVISAIKLLSDKDTLGLSLRRFSISTSGVIPGIDKLAKEKNFPVNLAISLHSAIDEKRTQLMPINATHPLSQLSKSIYNYFEKTKRKIMYEYILLSGLNTSEKDALALRDFVRRTEAAYIVNLIPINATDCGYTTPSNEEIATFKKYLDKYNVDYIQRFSFGQDIQAACGQLAKSEGTSGN